MLHQKALSFILVGLGCSTLGAPKTTWAAQSGPVFPSHRFPTDESFHLSYRLSYLTTNANYVSSNKYDHLTDRFSLIGHTFTGEIQPNRQLSIGAALNASSAALNPLSGDSGVSTSRLGDQRIFAEFRFFDQPGRSMGFALVSKFPGYKNPTSSEIAAKAADEKIVLIGDAQIDLTPLFTTELWLTSTVRTRFDVGYTLRTSQFPNEIPTLISIAYVNPRLDLDFRVKSYAAISGSSSEINSQSTQIDDAAAKTAFANSDWAYADKPWAIILQPTAEFWISPSFALTFDANLSLMGKHSAHFREFALGITLRSAQTHSRKNKTFQEIDIRTDQEQGYFPGEMPSTPPNRPRPVPPGADEEF